MLETGITHRHPLTFIRQHNARRAVQKVVEDKPVVSETGRLPRVARLMALALRFEHLLACGAVHDQAELAELGHVRSAGNGFPCRCGISIAWSCTHMSAS